MNQAAFDAAVREIAGATNRLLESLAQPDRRTDDRAAQA
jgi:hypothetical protein